MAPSNAQQLGPGSSLGPFRIERLLGAGGMARVYLAEDTLLARRVALKVLLPERSEDPFFRDRFLREARLAAELQHPNIVPIYDADERDGQVYLVMAYVDGRSLGELVEQEGPLDPARSVDIVAQVAGALDVAHANGLVHRDVKPGNILVEASPPGRALLTDFGIALETSRAPEALTRRGELFGTVAWVSPEQITGRSLDERTDIYSLGAVLFYAVTGKEPFARDTDPAVLYAHLSEPPPRVSDHVAWDDEPSPDRSRAVAEALDAVVAKALAKDPAERFRSARDLAGAARDAVGAAAGVAPPPPPAPSAPPPEVPAAPPAQKEAEPPPQPPPPAGAAAVRLRLDAAFEYVHEPLESDRYAVPFLGDDAAVDALKERIRHSRGGAFLVTGFRGVGKTTIIKRALRELRAEAGAETKVLHVSLNVARPVSTEALLFEVVRRLFEELSDRGVLASLHEEVQRAVILAYTRTSLSFKETRASASERARSLGLSLEALPMVGRIGPNVDFSSRQTDSLATEAAFLAYSDADVEHDFLRIVDLLRRDHGGTVDVPRASRWPRLRRRLRGAREARRGPWQGRLIVVIDELDKLTATATGVEALEGILSALKNLLSTRGVHFLFVAGPDLHDLALRESQRGSSVYESVFGWQLYVPCVWDAADELLGEIVLEPTGEWYETLRDHLAFKARGIPRLLLLELNSFVHWDGEGPTIALDPVDARRITFYAELQRILRDFMAPAERGGAAFAIPIDEDRWRLGAYYVVDWILRSRGRVFTVDELVSSTHDETPLDPNLVLSEGKVRELLDHLIAGGILERPDVDRALIGDAPGANVTTYRVVEDIYEKLGRFERWSERERGDPAAAAGAQPWAEAASLGVVGDGRYELRRELGQSSLGTVYRTYDLRDRREVALKLLDTPGLLADERAKSRFRQAADVATALSHPNLVATLDTFEDAEGRLGIVLELVEGTSLATLLSWGPLPGRDAVRIALDLLDALAYLHEHGLARFDLKPSSIMLDETRRPLLSDVGLAKVVDETLASARKREQTATGVQVGTPRYMAPEQARGEAVDIRADIYGVGLILYEMLVGDPAFDDADPFATLARIALGESVDVSAVPGSPELRAALARALERDPARRYAEPSEMRAALAGVPEAAELQPV